MSGATPETGCPGCGVHLPAFDGPTHAYLGASAACWAKFGELCSREYEDRAYAGVHQLSVDAYAVQHPGEPERRTIQSVAVHLMTLSLFLEQGTDPAAGPRLHKRMVRHRFRWLKPPPATAYRLTVLDAVAVNSADEHQASVRAWATDVWAAWEVHHGTIRNWIGELD